VINRALPEAADSGSPERQLWCAVVGRALQDALDRIATVSAPTERQKLRRDALSWFAGNGNEFRAACERAGYDPDFLRSRVLTMADSVG
jgi:hypothetical protein